MLSPCMLPKSITSGTNCNINPLAESSKSTSIKAIESTSSIMKDTTTDMEEDITSKTTVKSLDSNSTTDLTDNNETIKQINAINLSTENNTAKSEIVELDESVQSSEEKTDSKVVAKTQPQNESSLPTNILSSLFEDKEEDRIIPDDIKSTVPVLKGKLSVRDKLVVWEGLWGMSEAAFQIDGGITSKFEMKSSDAPHNEIFPEVEDIESVNKDMKKEAFIYNIFNGYFHLQTTRGKSTSVTEKSLFIGFMQSTTNMKEYCVRGKGTNRFGEFILKGNANLDTKELIAYKIYLPKKAAIQTNNNSSEKNRVTLRRRPNTNTVKKTSNDIAVTSPVPDPTDPNNLSLQKRSERKRSLPAHLREDSLLAGLELSSKLDPFMRKCMTTLQYLLSHSQASAFISPVDPIALNIPDYFDIIKEPMDLGSIRKEIENGELNDIFEFGRKVRLVFTNAITYNKAEHPIHQHAQRLLTAFNHRFQRVLEFYEKENKLSGVESLYSTPSTFTKNASKKLPSTTSRGGKGPRAISRSNKKTSKQTQIELMRQEIEMMRAELNTLHAQQSIAPSKKSNVSGAAGKKRKTTTGGKSCFKIENLTEEDLNRPMTMNEKRELSININRLPQAKIDKVVTIIGERIPLDRIQTPNDEIEIDLNSCDNSTLRIIEAYVNDALLHINKRKRKTNPTGSNGSSGRTTPLNNIAIAASITSNLELAQQIELSTKEKIRNVQEELDALNGNGKRFTKEQRGTTGSDSREQSKAKPDMLDSDSASSEDDDDLSSDSDSDDETDVNDKVLLENLPLIRQHTVSDHSELLHHDNVLQVKNINAWENMITKDNDTTNETSLWSTALSLEKDKQMKEQNFDEQNNP